MSLLIFIPARSGSKRIKSKNMFLLNGKPLIYYTLKLTKKLCSSLKNTKVLVSSDDLKIQNYANNFFKKNINYQRPNYVSKDKSTMAETLLHCLKKLNLQKKLPKFIVLLQPTSPIRSLKIIINAINKIKANKKISSIVSISKPIEEPKDLLIENKKKKYSKLVKDKKSLEYYTINGNFYIIRSSFILKKKKIFDYSKNTKFIKIEKKISLDINDLFDMKICESLIK